jgi:hypothetical protein
MNIYVHMLVELLDQWSMSASYRDKQTVESSRIIMHY